MIDEKSLANTIENVNALLLKDNSLDRVEFQEISQWICSNQFKNGPKSGTFRQLKNDIGMRLLTGEKLAKKLAWQHNRWIYLLNSNSWINTYDERNQKELEKKRGGKLKEIIN